nr:hypothetical protein OG296_38060 [Streptomyces sp. NBC_01001]
MDSRFRVGLVLVAVVIVTARAVLSMAAQRGGGLAKQRARASGSACNHVG